MEAGEVQTRDFHPTLDPYRVQSIPVSDNFRFKAVIVGDEHAIEYIALYTYYLGKRDPVLLHEVKFRAPTIQAAGSASGSLGTHFVYSPVLEREFRYDCVLREGLP